MRDFAVQCLDRLSTKEIIDCSIQLVQALKYERMHFSPLAVLLIKKALSDKKLSHSLVWLFKAELDETKNFRNVVRFKLILETFFALCDPSERNLYFRDFNLVKYLKQISLTMKHYNEKNKSELSEKLRNLLKSIPQK